MSSAEAKGLRLRDLELRYADRIVLSGVRLDLESGQRVAVIGPNGSGKTTLLRAVAGIVTPTRGHITWNGEALPDLSRQEIARRIAYVPQEEHWEFPFTVEEVVRCGRFTHATSLFRESEADRAAIDRALAAAGIEALRERPIDALSGGERRRAVLARALAQEAGVLLLDEPTTALDLEHRHGILAVLRELRATILLATHDLDAAARCDRVLVLVDGGIAVEGTPEEVLQESLLRDVFKVRVRVRRENGRIHVLPE